MAQHDDSDQPARANSAPPLPSDSLKTRSGRLQYGRTLLHTSESPAQSSLPAYLLLLDAVAELRTLLASRVAVSETSTALAYTQSERWLLWTDYVAQVYLPPSDGSCWSPPLVVHTPSIVSSIAELISTASRPVVTDFDAQTALQRCCCSCLDHLAATKNESKSAAQALFDSAAVASEWPPTASDSLLSTITSTLAMQRRNYKPHSASSHTHTFRWVLATTLQTHLDPDAFGQQQHSSSSSSSPVQPGGPVITLYARDSADDRAIKAYFALPDGTCGISEQAMKSIEEETSDEDGVGPNGNDDASALRAAERSITKRDDKMRWVFGDDFQKQAQAAAPATAPKRRSIGRFTYHGSSNTHAPVEAEALVDQDSASRRHRRRPVSLSSLESLTSHGDGHRFSTASSRTDAVHVHRRIESTSSSVAPLLSDSSASTTSPTHTMFLRRHPSDSQTSNSPVSPPPPSLQPLSPGAPFQDLFSLSLSESPRRAESDPRPENGLSAAERREMLRKSRKLERVLGVPIEEGAASRLLGRTHDSNAGRRPSIPHARSWSEPSPSPTSSTFDESAIASFALIAPELEHSAAVAPLACGARRMSRSLSVPASPSRSTTAGDAAHHDSPSTSPSRRLAANHPRIPNASSFSALGGTRAQQREERRRKLAKLQRVLGECVPVEIALRDVPGRGTSPSLPRGILGRKKSGFGGRLRGALGLPVSGHASDTQRAGSGNVAEELLIIATPDAHHQQSRRASAPLTSHGSNGSAVVSELQKARKLENLFGDLPPRDLYLANDATTRRRQSDLSFLSHASSLSHSASIRTIDTYRASIASMQHLAEKDPEALHSIVTTAYGVDGPATKSDPALASPPLFGESESIFADPFRRAAGEPPATNSVDDEDAISLEPQTSARLSRSSSVSAATRLTSKRATKLSHFFGTTRGEVWGMLLTDLQTAIEEEDDLEPEEKAEVLSSVKRLRDTTKI